MSESAASVLGWPLDELRVRAESSAKATCTRTACLEPEVHELAAFVVALINLVEARNAATAPGPAKVLVMASVLIPGDQAMPLADFEAYVAQALKDGGVLPVWVSADFVEAAA